MKSQLTINTKTKYTESKKYQKHFSLDDRIKIQKIITENRDDTGAMTILLKDIGNIFQNDPSTISKEVKLHRIKKERPFYSTYSYANSLCENFNTCKKTINNGSNKFCKAYSYCTKSCPDFKEMTCSHLKKFPWVCNGCKRFKDVI